MKLKIKVTKDIIKRAKWCGWDSKIMVAESCAIALAIRDLFPNFIVSDCIYERIPGWLDKEVCKLPKEAKKFIMDFDNLKNYPEKRLELEPIEFEVDIPEKYFPEISEVHKILANCQTMELV